MKIHAPGTLLAALGLLLTIALFSLPLAPAPALAAFATNTPFAPETTPTTPEAVSTPAPVVEQERSGPRVFEPDECRYAEDQPTSEACIAIMEQYPRPDVTEIRADSYTLDNYSFWRVGPQPVPVYEAPGGGVIGEIPQGFNFVRVTEDIEGWIKAEDGRWINKNDAYYVRPSFFRGVMLPPGWDQPFGWILDTTGIWASTYPGGPSTSESGLVPLHHQRFNIFAEAVAEDGWTWYMVGPNQWVKQIYMTVIKPIERPEGVSGRWVAIDLFEQSLVAYEDDQPVYATLISTGLPGTETNEGLFTVWARLARDAMTGSTGAPNAYALQSVPWVMYFDGSISLHGTYWHNFFGYRRSRGCVNLSISDARWVFDWMNAAPPNDEGELVNHVLVHSSGEYRRP